MTVFSVSFVGKHNEPLFIANHSTDAAESSHIEGIVHASLDIIDERRTRKVNPAGQSATMDMFMGQLFIMEEYKVFAYYSNTHTKTIIVCDVMTSENSIKDFILSLYHMFIVACQNPFQKPGQQITSTRFKAKIQKILSSTNST